jgi:predicted small lipoprotein YifL
MFLKAVLVILMIFLVSAGCTGPVAQPPATILTPDATPGITVQEKHPAATAERYQSEKIRITYTGGPDADHLIELQTTVITKIGSVNIQSMGSRVDTTPVQIGGTDIFQGPYADPVHVITTAYYVNGTHEDVLDTWI